MLVKDVRYDPLESVKENEIWLYKTVGKEKKTINNNRSKIIELTSSSCTVSSVNRANANGMKFSGISTASVNISQLRSRQLGNQ